MYFWECYLENPDVGIQSRYSKSHLPPCPLFPQDDPSHFRNEAIQNAFDFDPLICHLLTTSTEETPLEYRNFIPGHHLSLKRVSNTTLFLVITSV
ncbi:hypothetical protein CEXT_450601 [Caerostris extrusa]|uniref:Uncharacterized protein n=1 Tax=Caerostris extrusa TaxID=172846 RepID=A0AAV4UKA0_CAEEX|nr:hypothetical protein CEXT_450601 [Caerostris extrusa]